MIADRYPPIKWSAVNLNSGLMLLTGLQDNRWRSRSSAFTLSRGEVMSKQFKETGDTFRPSKKPLTEYEEE